MTNIFRGPLNGSKVFLIFSSFFVVIITVNVFMAYSAISTFPGLETRNSYVVSQDFNTDRAAQEALGWTISASVSEDELILSISDDAGHPVELQDIAGIFGRATMARDDQSPDFRFDGTAYRAAVTATPGNWNLRLTATAPDGTAFRQRLVILVTP